MWQNSLPRYQYVFLLGESSLFLSMTFTFKAVDCLVLQSTQTPSQIYVIILPEYPCCSCVPFLSRSGLGFSLPDSAHLFSIRCTPGPAFPGALFLPAFQVEKPFYLVKVLSTLSLLMFSDIVLHLFIFIQCMLSIYICKTWGIGNTKVIRKWSATQDMPLLNCSVMW